MESSFSRKRSYRNREGLPPPTSFYMHRSILPPSKFGIQGVRRQSNHVTEILFLTSLESRGTETRFIWVRKLNRNNFSCTDVWEGNTYLFHIKKKCPWKLSFLVISPTPLSVPKLQSNQDVLKACDVPGALHILHDLILPRFPDKLHLMK